MQTVTDLQFISPGLAVWQAYDPSVKVDCTSTALRTSSGWLLIDPIPLASSLIAELGTIAAIVLTSGNHERASHAFRKSLGLSIHSPIEVREELGADFGFAPHSVLPGDVSTIPVPGGAMGESALLFDKTLIFGDAVVNLGDLQILPARYCENSRLLSASLRGLLDLDFERVCFAHGLPLLNRAKDRLAGLLA